MAVIEVEGLTRTFQTRRKRPGIRGALWGLVRSETESVTAVDRISFRVEPGELVGFLGPNGAGKTTTLKMLSGLLHPTAGTARVLGFVPWERRNEFRRQFALLLGQKNQLWWDLPARESLELNARIYGLAPADFRRTLDELTALLSVGDKLNVMVRELSLGERMKFELVAALLHQPRVLFLDEPTIGLDVVSQQVVREFLRDYNARRGTTILLTSHYLTDIQALCRRVIIIDHGRRFFDGPLQDILDRFVDYKVVTVHTDAAGPLAVDALASVGEVVENAAGRARLRIKRDRVVSGCKFLLDAFPVTDLDIEEVPIEDVIRQLFAPPAAGAMTPGPGSDGGTLSR
jgi:ABC-2 type transport system ATP-binding protein